MPSTSGRDSPAAEFDRVHVAIFKRRKLLNQELAAARNASQRAAAQAKIDELKAEWMREWTAHLTRVHGAEYLREQAAKRAWGEVITAWQLRIEDRMADFVYECRHCDLEIRYAGVDDEYRYTIECCLGDHHKCWIRAATPDQWKAIGKRLKGETNE